MRACEKLPDRGMVAPKVLGPIVFVVFVSIALPGEKPAVADGLHSRADTLLEARPERPGGSDSGTASPVDKIRLKDGKSLEGTLFDVTDAKVILIVGNDKKVFPRKDVKEIVRSAPKKVLEFFEKKYEEYKKTDTAKSWKNLAEFCKKKGIQPERRRALREIVRVAPDDTEARGELGHAQFEGNWLDEEATAARIKEGYELVDGKLVKPSSTPSNTDVKKPEPDQQTTYRILERKKLTPKEREKMEAERQKRLKSAEAFLAQKHKEYDGVAWDKRNKVKTQFFEVQCNSTMQVTQAYGKLMEIIRAKLSEMLKSRVLRNLRAPVFIYASQEDFMNQDDFARWGGRGLGGYYNPISQAITTYHGTFGFTGTTFGVLCHEGTHYYQGLVLQQFDNLPIWLIEGLAVYFGDGSIFDPVKAKISVGNIPRDRLAHIQEKMMMGRQSPVEELVTIDRRSGRFSGSTYADAWALIYFLVNSGEAGKNLLTNYWAIGLNQPIGKKDFKTLAEKYFESIEALEKQYIEYISKLDMPPAGKVIGDYFVSDTFQFDFKAPGDDWEFFDDKEDRKLLIGLMHPGTPAEIRVYYENNLENTKSEKFFENYLKYARNRYKDVQSEKVKISNLDGYRVSYVDDKTDVFELSDLSELVGFPDQARGQALEKKRKKRAERGPREVVKFLLIQVDGVVAIECSTKKGEGEKYADIFNKVNENFTLTLTRRW